MLEGILTAIGVVIGVFAFCGVAISLVHFCCWFDGKLEGLWRDK